MMENKKMRAEHPKKELVVDILYDIIGSILFGAGIYTFAEGGNFAPGGISGIALIMNKLWNLPVGTMTLNTEYSTGHHQLQDSRKAVFDEDCEDNDYFNHFCRSCISDVPILYRTASACSDLLGSIAWTWDGSFLYERFFFGRSRFPDDDDQKKRPHMSLGRLTLLIDLIIILIGWPVFGDVDSVLYGLIAVFVCSVVIDKILYGIGAGTLAIIVTSKGEETAEEIGRITDRGVTSLEGMGYLYKE